MVRARMRKFSLSRKGRLRVEFELSDCSDNCRVSFVLALRRPVQVTLEPGSSAGVAGRLTMDSRVGETSEYFHVLAAKRVGKNKRYKVDAEISALAWHESYWDALVRIQPPVRDGSGDLVPLKTPKLFGPSLKARCVQAYLPHDGIVFPYVRGAGELAFTYRVRQRQDAPSWRLKELAADVAYVAGGKRIRKRNLWVVYEKFSSRAQDNGYYFFKYCMENLPLAERKRIYYVIDKRSEDYERVRQWDSQVCDFMSTRHLLYASCAQMLVASESRMHAYLWRAKPSFIRRRIYETPTFFLQHGVMALKRIDGVFGKSGEHPVDYFTVSSEAEQDVIAKNFGYAPARIPVLGLARWDELVDESSVDAPMVLVMPTWREWMAYDDEADFLNSDYCVQYRALLSNEVLLDALRQAHATLAFYVHPRFSRFSRVFEGDGAVRIVQADELPLGQLIRECSALVTDYSSVTWDVAYQHKPVFFFQFDRDDFLKRTGSYIDFERDLPGPSFSDADELAVAIAQRAATGFSTTPQEELAADRWFAYRDQHNCERTYRCALEAAAELSEERKRASRDYIREAKCAYVRALDAEPIDARAIMLESRHGETFEGNMYYVAHELLSNPRYADYQLFVPYRRDRLDLVRKCVACLPGDVTLLEYKSPEYYQALARCKFLFNDTSYLHAYIHRPGQVYVNTWHGTPLKHLGRYVPDEVLNMGNVHRNLLYADVVLSPNRFTADRIFDAYMMRGQFKGRSVIMPYPRNGVLLQDERRRQVRAQFGLEEKKVYAYMPTYRGLNNDIAGGYAAEVDRTVRGLASQLDPDELLYVNLHSFVADQIDLGAIEGVRMFPADVPSYDFLAAADALITDYSSVMFDFACTGRPIVLYTVDLEQYCEERGLYLDIRDLSFPTTKVLEDVVRLVRTQQPGCYDADRLRFCPKDAPDAARQLLDYVLDGAGGPECYEPPSSDERPKVLVAVGNTEPQQMRTVLEERFDDPGLARNHYYLTFARSKGTSPGFIREAGDDLDFYAYGGDMLLSKQERIARKIAFPPGTGLSIAPDKLLGPALEREWERRYGYSTFDRCACLPGTDRLTRAVLAAGSKKASARWEGEARKGNDAP